MTRRLVLLTLVCLGFVVGKALVQRASTFYYTETPEHEGYPEVVRYTGEFHPLCGMLWQVERGEPQGMPPFRVYIDMTGETRDIRGWYNAELYLARWCA
jgi:hypothetical protein